LASLGIIPREAVLFLTGIMIFYMIFSSVEDSLWLTVASIPLFVALPISDSFDTLASWRIIIAVLFLCLFFKKGISLNLVRSAKGRIRIKENLKHYGLEYIILAFLLVGLLSVSVADYKILAVKKLLFLINIFLLFLIARNIVRSEQSIVRLWRAAAVGGVVVIAIALIQFVAALFAPLFLFWQFWADKVIGVFYGQNLSYLLSYSNTWFAYYASNPPTLRLFSIFPDSHSFAMFCILIIPVFLTLALVVENQRKRRIFYWLMAGLAFLGIALSGSRGAWLSVLPVIAVAFYFYLKKLETAFFKKAILSLVIFAVLFLASIGYPPLLYKFQAWQTGTEASSTFSFFERAKSISDIGEISNKGRLEIWGASLKSVAKHPFLGVGLGNYVTVLEQNISAAKKGASAHNLYLDLTSETGIFGGLLLFVLFANIFYTSWLVFRRAKETHFKFYGLLVGLYFLWIAAYSFFDVVLLNDKVLLMLMVVLAALYNIRNIIFNPDKI